MPRREPDGRAPMERVGVLIWKEWMEAARNRTLVMTGVLICVLFAFFPLFILGTTGAAAREAGNAQRGRTHAGRAAREGLPPGWARDPAYRGLSVPEIVQAHFSGQFLVFFLVGP